MNEGPKHPDGWSHSFRRMGGSLLGLAQSRFELFAVELQEEKLRALSLVAWLAVALALIVAGLCVALGALALYLWSVAGYLGLVMLAAASVAAGAGVLGGIRRGIRTGPTSFAETIGEFKKDRECLRNDN